VGFTWQQTNRPNLIEVGVRVAAIDASVTIAGILSYPQVGLPFSVHAAARGESRATFGCHPPHF
jgi:hypothetical protein